MTKKQSPVIKKSTNDVVITDITPIDYETLSVGELCAMEVVYEEMKKVKKKKGAPIKVSISSDLFYAKLAEKKREKRETGKVTTTVPPGTFSYATEVEH